MPLGTRRCERPVCLSKCPCICFTRMSACQPVCLPACLCVSPMLERLHHYSHLRMLSWGGEKGCERRRQLRRLGNNKMTAATQRAGVEDKSRSTAVYDDDSSVTTTTLAGIARLTVVHAPARYSEHCAWFCIIALLCNLARSGSLSDAVCVCMCVIRVNASLSDDALRTTTLSLP